MSNLQTAGGIASKTQVENKPAAPRPSTSDILPNAGKFELRAPSAQTAVDIFGGHWASNLHPVCGVSGTGKADLFHDYKIALAADALGARGRFDGMSILELGPLEGAHTYQLEQLGAAKITAVESNREAYLKCLTVKELLGLRSKFLCGDVAAYLSETTEQFDFIFCSGILYHMADPLALIRLVSEHAPKAFFWTHYVPDDRPLPDRKPRSASSHGFTTTYYERPYQYMNNNTFWGGVKQVVAWMSRAEILRALRHFGFKDVRVLKDDPTKPSGPAFSISAERH